MRYDLHLQSIRRFASNSLDRHVSQDPEALLEEFLLLHPTSHRELETARQNFEDVSPCNSSARLQISTEKGLPCGLTHLLPYFE